jgi:hypothetical protein
MSRTRWQRRAPDFYLTANDTSPSIAYQLLDGLGAPVVLTGAAVEFHMQAPGSAVKVNAAATITDATLGKVRYDFLAANTDTPGDYLARWQVVYSGGAIESFPDGDLLKVRILDDIAA